MTQGEQQDSAIAREQVVFRSDHVEVFAHPGNSPFLLVTFSEMGMRPNGRHWWGAPVARKLGLAALAFVAVRPNWFPESAVAEALAAPAVAGFLAAHPRRVTYGFSMGGHGALRHARRLGAEAAIAIAPQWSIDPGDTREGDTRFLRHFDPALNRGMRIDPEHGADRTFLIFDPRDNADRWNAERIGAALPQAVPVHARSTGHWTAAALASSEAAERIFAAALGGRDLALRRAVADARRAWPRRGLVMARQIARLRPRVALRIAGRHAPPGSDPELQIIFESAGDALVYRRQFDEADSAARLALGLSANSFYALAVLAEIALQKGQNERALDLIGRSLALTPDSPGAHFRMAAFLRKTGNPEAAEEMRLKGVALQQRRAVA